MAHLLLPLMAAQQLSSDYRLPPLLQEYQLQGSTGTVIHSNEVTIFVQSLVVNGFTYGYHILQVRQPAGILFICTEGSGILHYPLQGSLNIRQPDGTPVLHWNKEQYGLGYYPTDSTLVLYFETGLHHFFQLAFSLNFLQQLLLSLPSLLFEVNTLSPEPIFTSELPASKKLKDLIRQVLANTYQSSPAVLQLNNCALQLTARFVQDYHIQERKRFWEQKKELQLARLETYIGEHLDTDAKPLLSIPALAKKTGTSPYHFKKLFRQQFGLSPTDYIHQKRLEKAMQMLTSSAIPAGDIYQAIGYTDFSSFSRAFRTYYGHPPSYYRST